MVQALKALASVASVFLVLVLGIQIVGTILYLILLGQLFGRLKQSDKQGWETLGSPSLILNNSPRNNWLLLRWLWKRDFLQLGTQDTVELARTVRALLFFLCGNLAVFMLMFGIGLSLGR